MINSIIKYVEQSIGITTVGTKIYQIVRNGWKRC